MRFDIVEFGKEKDTFAHQVTQEVHDAAVNGARNAIGVLGKGVKAGLSGLEDLWAQRNEAGAFLSARVHPNTHRGSNNSPSKSKARSSSDPKSVAAKSMPDHLQNKLAAASPTRQHRSSGANNYNISGSSSGSVTTSWRDRIASVSSQVITASNQVVGGVKGLKREVMSLTQEAMHGPA